jgi:hypothetical protein
LGLRVVFNDVNATQVLAGVIHELDGQGEVFRLESSRRVGDNWRVELALRLWSGIDARDAQRSLDRDDHIMLRVFRYF